MKELTILDTLTLSVPDNFREMNESEKKSLRYVGSGPAAVLKSEEDHMIVNLGYKSPGRLMSSLFSEETLAKGAEKGIRKASGAYGYRLLGFGECRVGGKTGTSFRYTYQAQGIDMAAECCVVKVNGTFFYLYVYYRAEREEESCRIWKEILERVRWAA